MNTENIKSKLLILGEFLDGGNISWEWYNPLHSRMAIVGSDENSPKKEILNGIAATVNSAEGHSVFRICESSSEPSSNDIVLIDLLEFEKIPSPIEAQNDANTFTKQRHFFASSFIDLLSIKLNIPRKELLPPVSFRRQTEGPLNGYYRSAMKLDNSKKHKNQILEYFDSLSKIKWKVTDNGFIIVCNKSDDVITKTLEFLKGIWAFWAFSAAIPMPQQMVLIMEPPKELALPSTDKQLKEIVKQSILYMEQITYMITCCTILSTETLFPVPETSARFKMFLNLNCPDFSLETPENRSIFPQRLFDEWKEGNTHAGVLIDDTTHRRYLLNFDKAYINWHESAKV